MLGLASDGLNWEVIARGLFPASAKTMVPVQNRYRKLRVAAESSNWIGIGEVQVVGTALASALAGPLTVRSNVPEDPVYSLAWHYQAANLMDGDPSTAGLPRLETLGLSGCVGYADMVVAGCYRLGLFRNQSSLHPELVHLSQKRV